MNKFLLILSVFILLFVLQCTRRVEWFNSIENTEALVRKIYYSQSVSFQLAQVNEQLVRFHNKSVKECRSNEKNNNVKELEVTH